MKKKEKNIPKNEVSLCTCYKQWKYCNTLILLMFVIMIDLYNLESVCKINMLSHSQNVCYEFGSKGKQIDF